jgi:uncharacterized protein
MNTELPLRIDPVLFAQQEREIQGEIRIAELPEIAGVTSKPDNLLTIVMSFSKSSLQYPLVKGTIEGEVVQSCQRCLGDTIIKINETFELLLVTSETSDTAEQEGHEVFEYNEVTIDMLNFIEEEVMLALPIVAKHESVDECLPIAQKWIKNKEHVPADQKKENPFAKLKDLKN